MARTDAERPDRSNGWQRFKAWWRDTKPTDVLTVLMSLLSVAIAFWALYKANQVADQQEEASAPVLAPGTPLDQRGRKETVFTDYKPNVVKRADKLFLDPSRGRLVIPVNNGGAGIALVIGHPIVVGDCDREPSMLPPKSVDLPVGSYVIRSGASDQLAFLPPASNPAVHYVTKGIWYTFAYKGFGVLGHRKANGSNLGSVLIWYTDGAQRKLRWTCITYLSTPDNYGSEWSPYASRYGTRAMVAPQPGQQ